MSVCMLVGRSVSAVHERKSDIILTRNPGYPSRGQRSGGSPPRARQQRVASSRRRLFNTQRGVDNIEGQKSAHARRAKTRALLLPYTSNVS
eukprot:7390386-Prymnesium_polylepis.2